MIGRIARRRVPSLNRLRVEGRFGSLADLKADITRMSGSGGKADLLHLSMRRRNIDTAWVSAFPNSRRSDHSKF